MTSRMTGPEIQSLNDASFEIALYPYPTNSGCPHNQCTVQNCGINTCGNNYCVSQACEQQDVCISNTCVGEDCEINQEGCAFLLFGNCQVNYDCDVDCPGNYD
jgi:hypothetical protein